MSFNLKLSSGSSESDLKDPTEEDIRECFVYVRQYRYRRYIIKYFY